MSAAAVPSPVRSGGWGAGLPAPHAPVTGPGRRQLVHRRVRATGSAALLALLALDLAAPDAVSSAALAVAVGGILLGLPHGAVDHLLPGWLAARPLPALRLSALLAGYALVVAAGALALWHVPVPTVVAFLVVSGWHFGRGEVVEAAEAAGRRLPSAREDLLPALAHGLATTALPIAAWPTVSLPLLAVLAPGFARTPGWVPPALGVVSGLLVAGGLVRLVLRRRAVEAAELALLAVVFWTVHPFAAFGVYFGLWHSLRHGARLVDLAAGGEPLTLGLRRVAVQAVLPTAAAVVFLTGVVLTASLAPAPSASGLLAAQLATLVGLTFPHAVVVAGLDRWVRLRG